MAEFLIDPPKHDEAHDLHRSLHCQEIGVAVCNISSVLVKRTVHREL
jgi:hypothetical protein